MNKTYRLASIPIMSATADELMRIIGSRAEKSQKTLLFFANTNLVVKCQPIASQLDSKDVVIVNDGIGVDIGCRLIHGEKFTANLNGTDFTPYYFQHSSMISKVFLIGSTQEVLDKASLYLTQTLGQEVVGMCDGFSGVRDSGLIARINASGADVVLVAMGNPLQEMWILDNHHQLNAPLLLGVGALFDFWAGDKPRAPRLVQQLHLEWLFRLSLEPRRLFKRYTIDIVRFLYICIKN